MTSLSLREVEWIQPVARPARASTGTLLVACPERKGIVGSLEQLLYGHGARVLSSAQHTVDGTYFQRIRFDLSATNRFALEAGVREVSARFAMDYRLTADRRRRIAILVSGQDHCLYDLLIRHRADELACDVAMVISNQPDCAESTAHFGIAFHRLADPAELSELLAGIELVVLAGYAPGLPPELIDRFPSRIITIRSAFLPAFAGADLHRQAYDKGVKLVGATAHYLIDDPDGGPIIEQEVIRCSHRDSVDDFVRKGRDLEKRVLAAAVRWHLEDRVMVHAGKSVVFD